MLVLRLLVMVLTIICLMDGYAEVSSSTTGIRDRRENPAVKTNDSEVEILDRKKKKKPKPGKKKKTKPGKKKKPNKAKPKPTKPVTTTPTVSTSTLKTTTILTTPTVTTTVTTTTTTVSPTTTATTAKTTTSTASATTTLSTTTSATTTATTTVATSSTASTTTTTIPTTATTSSLPTTAATTADSGAGGECKATNGKPCIFPFKDGKEYNECKNEGGKYFWCATSVYDSGKYKHWSYCSTDGPCPLEGDGECRATNNKPCVFPFKDGNKEYNECADHGGKYFWCATGTNSAGKYTAWSECPKDGSCPLPPKSTTAAMTSTATAASTTPLTTGTIAATDEMEEKVFDTLESLVLGESRDDSLQMAHILDKKLDTIIQDLEGETSKTEQSYSEDLLSESGRLNRTIKRGQDDKVRDGTELGEGLMFVLSTVDSMKSVSRASGDCCQDCKSKYPKTELAEYWKTLDTCYCYNKIKNLEPKTRPSSKFTTKACGALCQSKKTRLVQNCPNRYHQVTAQQYVQQREQLCEIGTFTDVNNANQITIEHCAVRCENDPLCTVFSHEDFTTLHGPAASCVAPAACTATGPCNHRVCTLFYKAALGVQGVRPPHAAINDFCEFDLLVINNNLLVAPQVMPRPNIHMQILNLLDTYAMSCCNLDVPNPNPLINIPGHPVHCATVSNNHARQKAFIAWVPQNHRNPLQYIQSTYDPNNAAVGPRICHYHFSSIQNGRYNPGKDCLHTEEMLLPMLSPILSQEVPMNIYLFSRNSPCADGSVQGSTRGCIPRIFEYSTGNHCNNFLGRNFRSRQHSMKVGFWEFWHLNTITTICQTIDFFKRQNRVYPERLQFLKMKGPRSDEDYYNYAHSC